MRTVRDIMQRDVVTVAPEASARELARMLEDNHVSGVPVCESTGIVVGVVSASDLVRLAAEDRDDAVAWELDDDVEPDDVENDAAAWSYFIAEEPPPRFADIEQLHGPDLDDVTVSEIMSRAPVFVSPSLSIPELANMLLTHRIHRAVVAEDDRLVGIVTTLDVLRAVAAG
jgi:CBS domain-containing protein